MTTDELYKTVQAALSVFTQKTKKAASCNIAGTFIHTPGVDEIDVHIEGCGHLAFTLCNYGETVTIENLCNLSICRKAVKMIFKQINQKSKTIYCDCEAIAGGTK